MYKYVCTIVHGCVIIINSLSNGFLLDEQPPMPHVMGFTTWFAMRHVGPGLVYLFDWYSIFYLIFQTES